MSAQTIGDNISAKVDGDILYLAINMKSNLGPSKSGKMVVVGQTKGFKSINTSTGRALVQVSVYGSKESA